MICSVCNANLSKDLFSWKEPNPHVVRCYLGNIILGRSDIVADRATLTDYYYSR
jgi:hypothetical protein